MTTPWQVSASVTRVALEGEGRGVVTFTVTNPGPVDDRAVLDVVSSELAHDGWFTVDEPQRTVPHGGSATFSVGVAPPEEAPAGDHWLAARVYSASAAPEETSATSDRVSFTVPEREKPPPPKWWLWAIPAAVLVLVVVGVVAFLLLSDDDDPPARQRVEVPTVVGLAQAEAVQRLEQLGLVPVVSLRSQLSTPAGTVIATDPVAGESVEVGSTVSVVVAQRKLGPTDRPTRQAPTLLPQPGQRGFPGQPGVEAP